MPVNELALAAGRRQSRWRTDSRRCIEAVAAAMSARFFGVGGSTRALSLAAVVRNSCHAPEGPTLDEAIAVLDRLT